MKQLILIPFVSVALAQEIDRAGFRSQQGRIPTGLPGCSVQIDIPDPLVDGIIIELTEEEAEDCYGIPRWRVTEFEEGKFFAAVSVPLPDPLILDYSVDLSHLNEKWTDDVSVVSYVNNRLRDEVECEEVEPYPAPIDDAHTVLKTEECERVHISAWPEEIEFRGVNVGLKSHFVNRTVIAELTRWLIKWDMPDAPLGYELAVVEEFAPENGNARWHAQRYDDVTEEDCSPGGYRDTYPFQKNYWDGDLEQAHTDAARADWDNQRPELFNKNKGWYSYGYLHRGMAGSEPTWAGGSMRVVNTDLDERAYGRQLSKTFPGGERGCVAIARMELGYKFLGYGRVQGDDAGKLHNALNSTAPLVIDYTPYWERKHAWYKREHWYYGKSDVPNYVWNQSRPLQYREESAPEKPLEVPSRCLAPPPAPPPARTSSRVRRLD